MYFAKSRGFMLGFIIQGKGLGILCLCHCFMGFEMNRAVRKAKFLLQTHYLFCFNPQNPKKADSKFISLQSLKKIVQAI